MLKYTKNDSVRGSVPALGKGAPGLAGFHPYRWYSLQSIGNVGKGIIYSTKCFLFIQKDSEIISVCFKSRKSLNYIALPYQLFQSWIENELSNRVYIYFGGTTQFETPLQIWATDLSEGLFGPLVNVHVFEKSDSSTPKYKHYFEMYQNRRYIAGPSSGKVLDPLGENIDFRFSYTPKCMVSSMNSQKFSGEGLNEPPPQTPRSISGFAFDSRALCALNSPLQNVNNPSPNRGVLDQTEFSPNPNFLATPLDPIIISFQDYVVGIYTSDNILDGRLGAFSENPAWWTRHYTGTYSTRNYCTRSFHAF